MSNMRTQIVSACFATMIVLSMGRLGLCQSGQITGRISTPDGASAPNVAVSVVDRATGIPHAMRSNDDGYYTVPSLPPGTYSISVSAQGYKPILQEGIQLHVEQSLRVDFTLQLGAVTETVTVTTALPLLTTETSSVGQVVGSRDVVELPLLGRDAYALGELVPGVRGSIGMNNLPTDVISTSSISINGAAATTNDFLLDGAPNSAPSYNQPIIYPIADSVQEFRVQTNNYNAEFGRSAGGIYDVVTKGGTNDIHFSAYEFYRSNAMTSNNWFSKAAGIKGPPLSFNQFGGVVGGPVVLPRLYNGHNKTFFLFGTEYVRFNQGNTYTATVPDPTKLTGDFSADSVAIYNPFSTTSTGSGAYTRTAFAGNIIPQQYLNPIALKMATYFPKPQNSNAVNNYVVSDVNAIHENEITARVDEVITDRTSMFARYSYNNSPVIRPNPYGAGNQGSSAFGPQVFNRTNAVIQANHAFSGTLISTLRGSIARLVNSRGPGGLGFDIATLGFPSTLASQIGPPASFPVVTITGYGVSGSVPNVSSGHALGATGMIDGYMSTYSIQGNIDKTAGAHDIKVGTDLRLMQANILQTNDNSTNFAFTAAFTQGPNPVQAGAGDALASFLLGTPASGSVSPSPMLAMQTKYSAIYVQDNWKVKNSLTLNLGLRYDYETPYTERHNRLTNFDPNAAVPLTGVQGLKGALTFLGVNGSSRYDSKAYANHIAPRLGFAWHVLPKTVIHGGGGLFYGSLFGAAGEAPPSYGISGFTAATSMVTTLDNVTPYNTLSNPYPNGLVAATGSSLGAATLLGQAVTGAERNLKAVYTTQWNFGIQQQLAANWVIDVAYVGTHGFHEPVNLTLDQLPDSTLAQGSALNTLVANPFYGQIATGQLAQPTAAQGQLLRPYPQFTGVTSENPSWSQSEYNALQVSLQKKFSNGFSLQTSYTWSKVIDQGGVSASFNGETLGGGAIQDYNNLKAEKSTSLLDQTHRMVSSVMYQLPYLQEQHGVVGRVLGGWEISALSTFASGSPLGITSANNTSGSLGGGQRPNWNGQNPSIGSHTVKKWFNISDFSATPAYRFGSTPRTLNFLRSDWTRDIDVSLHKNVKITEKLHVQIRGDAFNMTNTPIFAPPNTSFGSAQFGVVSAQQNNPRAFQLGVKATY